MPSNQHMVSHYKDGMVWRLSYLYNGNSFTRKDAQKQKAAKQKEQEQSETT